MKSNSKVSSTLTCGIHMVCFLSSLVVVTLALQFWEVEFLSFQLHSKSFQDLPLSRSQEKEYQSTPRRKPLQALIYQNNNHSS
jgi:hypothetical protein